MTLSRPQRFNGPPILSRGPTAFTSFQRIGIGFVSVILLVSGIGSFTGRWSSLAPATLGPGNWAHDLLVTQGQEGGTSSPGGCTTHFPHGNGRPNNVSDVRAYYNWSSNGHFQGNGVTIVFVEAFQAPNLSADLSCFDSIEGLPPPVSLTIQQPWGAPPLTGYLTWPEETSLDVEWAHAIAPAAKLVVIEARNQSISGLIGLEIPYILAHYPWNGETMISMSFGLPEAWLGCGNITGRYAPLFQEVANSGDVAVAASGDTGAWADYANLTVGVNYPASDPNVLSVGGTHIDFSNNHTYGPEGVWYEPASRVNPFGGTGGGLSSCFGPPSYQTAEAINVTNTTTNFTPTHRAIPDVAYDAAYLSGYWFYDTSLHGPGWSQAGGTSFGAPQWAAILADIQSNFPYPNLGGIVHEYLYDQLLDFYSCLPQPSCGFTPTLHDINQTVVPYCNPVWCASSGYDAATGVGSPWMWNLDRYFGQVASF